MKCATGLRMKDSKAGGRNLAKTQKVWNIKLPGISIVALQPCCILTIGAMAEAGDEFTVPVSALLVKFTVARISQLPPPLTSDIQSPPVNLEIKCYRLGYVCSVFPKMG